MSQPGLVEVELPPPPEMVRLWARLVDAAGRRGFPQDATGDGGFVVTMAVALLVMWHALTREPGHGPGH